eukprot:264402-Rhodomonas_salina.2
MASEDSVTAADPSRTDSFDPPLTLPLNLSPGLDHASSVRGGRGDREGSLPEGVAAAWVVIWGTVNHPHPPKDLLLAQ